MRPFTEICWLMCEVREWLGHCCHDEDKQAPRFNIHEFIWQQCRKQWMQQCFLGANTKSPSENEQTLFTSSFTDGATNSMVLVMLVSYSVGHFIGNNPLTVSKETHWLKASRDLNKNLVQSTQDLKLLCTFQQNNDPKHKDKTGDAKGAWTKDWAKTLVASVNAKFQLLKWNSTTKLYRH